MSEKYSSGADKEVLNVYMERASNSAKDFRNYLNAFKNEFVKLTDEEKAQIYKDEIFKNLESSIEEALGGL